MLDMIKFLALDAATFDAETHANDVSALSACFDAANAAELDLIEVEELNAAYAQLASDFEAECEAITAKRGALAAETLAAETLAAETLAAETAPVSYSAQIINVLNARNSEQYSKDTDTAISIVKRSVKQIDSIFNQPAFNEIFYRLLRNMRIADNKQNKNDFVAVKVLVKIFNVLSSIASGQLTGIDTHTKIIGFQLVKLSTLTNKSAMVAQCKSIKYDALDTVQALDYKHTSSYTVGTTSTQTSSTRMLFNYLGMCDVIKGKQNDNIVIQDNARCKAFINLFAKNKHEENAE